MHKVSNYIFCYLLLLPSGDFTDTAGLSAEGITGRVLLILSAVVQLLVWTVTFAAVARVLLGVHLYLCVIDYARLHLYHWNYRTSTVDCVVLVDYKMLFTIDLVDHDNYIKKKLETRVFHVLWCIHCMMH